MEQGRRVEYVSQLHHTYSKFLSFYQFTWIRYFIMIKAGKGKWHDLSEFSREQATGEITSSKAHTLVIHVRDVSMISTHWRCHSVLNSWLKRATATHWTMPVIHGIMSVYTLQRREQTSRNTTLVFEDKFLLLHCPVLMPQLRSTVSSP